MPIYEYQCSACGHTLDALQKVADEPLVHCPTCGKPELKRQLSAPRFRLKGSGWYETDFKGKGDKKRNLAQSDSSPGSKPDTKPDSKTDTKPSGDAKKANKPAGDRKPASKSEGTA